MLREVVINPGTSVEAIKPLLYMVDQVLVMTVNPGFGGQKFLPETLKKNQAVRPIEAKLKATILTMKRWRR